MRCDINEVFFIPFHRLYQLILEKKQLLENCKEFVVKIKESDDQYNSELRRISVEANEALERERKSFSSGQEERQQKVNLL